MRVKHQAEASKYNRVRLGVNWKGKADREKEESLIGNRIFSVQGLEIPA